MNIFEYIKSPSKIFVTIKSKLLFLIYRKQLKYLGRKTFFQGKVWFYGHKFISIGANCSIGPYCRIEAIPENKRSKPKLIIGNRTSLQHAVHVYCSESLKIGNSVLIASGCMITDNNHGTNPCGDIYIKQKLEAKETIIEDEVWLGENVSVLKGSRIGKRSIIGANSVVNKDIPNYSMAAGNPAKVIKRYNFETKAWEKV